MVIELDGESMASVQKFELLATKDAAPVRARITQREMVLMTDREIEAVVQEIRPHQGKTVFVCRRVSTPTV